MYGDRRRRGERIRGRRHQMGGSVGLSFLVDPRNETAVSTVDDSAIRNYVDGCLRDRARFSLQNRVRLLRAALLVHLSVGQELLEQSHLPVRYRGASVLGNGREQVLVSQIFIFPKFVYIYIYFVV